MLVGSGISRFPALSALHNRLVALLSGKPLLQRHRFGARAVPLPEILGVICLVSFLATLPTGYGLRSGFVSFARKARGCFPLLALSVALRRFGHGGRRCNSIRQSSRDSNRQLLPQSSSCRGRGTQLNLKIGNVKHLRSLFASLVCLSVP